MINVNINFAKISSIFLIIKRTKYCSTSTKLILPPNNKLYFKCLSLSLLLYIYFFFNKYAC